jgi:hypothetical protein
MDFKLLLASKRRSLPFATALGVAILAWLGAQSAASYDRRETRAHAHADLANIVLLQAEMTEGFLSRIDQSLQFMSYVRQREGRDFDLAGLLAEGRLVERDVLKFSFIDPSGLVSQSNLPLGPVPVSVADRAHFRAIAEEGRMLDVGAPTLGRVSNRWAVQIARRAHGPDGALLGVPHVSVDVEVFGRLLEPADIPGEIALIGEDGVVRARGSWTQGNFANSTADADTMVRLRAATAGEWEHRGTDGAFVTLWRKVDAYPLFVTLTVPVETLTVGADARARFYWAAAAMAALIAFATAFAVARRQRRAEAALAAAHAADAGKAWLLVSLAAELRRPIDMLRGSIDALAEPAGEPARKRALADLRRVDAALGRAGDDAAYLARLMRESEELDLSAVDARLFARGTFERARARRGCGRRVRLRARSARRVAHPRRRRPLAPRRRRAARRRLRTRRARRARGFFGRRARARSAQRRNRDRRIGVGRRGRRRRA